jgi:hypothetical protein
MLDNQQLPTPEVAPVGQGLPQFQTQLKKTFAFLPIQGEGEGEGFLNLQYLGSLASGF